MGSPAATLAMKYVNGIAFYSHIQSFAQKSFAFPLFGYHSLALSSVDFTANKNLKAEKIDIDWQMCTKRETISKVNIWLVLHAASIDVFVFPFVYKWMYVL